MLAGVFKGYPGLNMEIERVQFEPPFEPFVHRWEAFAKARDEVQDPIAKKHVELLWTVLEAELRDAIREKNDHVAKGVVQFKVKPPHPFGATITYFKIEHLDHLGARNSRFLSRRRIQPRKSISLS